MFIGVENHWIDRLTQKGSVVVKQYCCLLKCKKTKNHCWYTVAFFCLFSAVSLILHRLFYASDNSKGESQECRARVSPLSWEDARSPTQLQFPHFSDVF